MLFIIFIENKKKVSMLWPDPCVYVFVGPVWKLDIITFDCKKPYGQVFCISRLCFLH